MVGVLVARGWLDVIGGSWSLQKVLSVSKTLLARSSRRGGETEDPWELRDGGSKKGVCQKKYEFLSYI